MTPPELKDGGVLLWSGQDQAALHPEHAEGDEALLCIPVSLDKHRHKLYEPELRKKTKLFFQSSVFHTAQHTRYCQWFAGSEIWCTLSLLLRFWVPVVALNYLRYFRMTWRVHAFTEQDSSCSWLCKALLFESWLDIMQFCLKKFLNSTKSLSYYRPQSFRWGRLLWVHKTYTATLPHGHLNWNNFFEARSLFKMLIVSLKPHWECWRTWGRSGCLVNSISQMILFQEHASCPKLPGPALEIHQQPATGMVQPDTLH